MLAASTIGNMQTADIAAAPAPPEPFVSADEAAKFIGISRRFLLSLARQGIGGAYALGTGLRQRNIWVFRLSELSAAIARKAAPIHKTRELCDPATGSPR